MAAHADHSGGKRDRTRLTSAARYANEGPREYRGPSATFMVVVQVTQSASDEITGSSAGLRTKFVSILKLLSLV